MKRFIVLFVIALITISIFIVRLPKIDPLSHLNADNIKTIKIRTERQQKAVTNTDEIKRVIEFIKNLEPEKLKNQEPSYGWEYWFLFDGWDKDISYAGDTAYIGSIR